MQQFIIEKIEEAESVRKNILSSSEIIAAITRITNHLWTVIERGGSIYFCGNGGSAADAQHLATELSGRFLLERQAIKAEALGTNIAFTTAVANDFNFQNIFSRSLEALGRSGDTLVCLSTSGMSKNVLQAVTQANKMNIKTVGITGSTQNTLNEICDFPLEIPSDSVPRIQEAYMLIGHIICEELELRLVKERNISN